MHSSWDFPSGRNNHLNSVPRCDVTTNFVYGTLLDRRRPSSRRGGGSTVAILLPLHCSRR